MNKHLLETKLKSIAHYNSELERIEEARKVTSSTLSDLMESLKEFCPFTHGDMLLNGGVVYRFRGIISVEYRSSEVRFNLQLQVQTVNNYSEVRWVDAHHSIGRVSISEFDLFKIIGNTENKPS